MRASGQVSPGHCLATASPSSPKCSADCVTISVRESSVAPALVLDQSLSETMCAEPQEVGSHVLLPRLGGGEPTTIAMQRMGEQTEKNAGWSQMFPCVPGKRAAECDHGQSFLIDSFQQPDPSDSAGQCASTSAETESSRESIRTSHGSTDSLIFKPPIHQSCG